MQNECVNVRKDSGIEEPCETPGNSAWVPDEPLPTPEDLGLTAGWDGDYYFFNTWANGDGYTALVDAPGRKPDVQAVTNEINYSNSQFYQIAPGFPGDRFQCHWTGKLPILQGGVYEF